MCGGRPTQAPDRGPRKDDGCAIPSGSGDPSSFCSELAPRRGGVGRGGFRSVVDHDARTPRASRQVRSTGRRSPSVPPHAPDAPDRAAAQARLVLLPVAASPRGRTADRCRQGVPLLRQDHRDRREPTATVRDLRRRRQEAADARQAETAVARGPVRLPGLDGAARDRRRVRRSRPSEDTPGRVEERQGRERGEEAGRGAPPPPRRRCGGPHCCTGRQHHPDLLLVVQGAHRQPGPAGRSAQFARSCAAPRVPPPRRCCTARRSVGRARCFLTSREVQGPARLRGPKGPGSRKEP